MAHSVLQLSKDLARTGKAIVEVPQKNARAMMRATEDELIRNQPKHFKQWDRRQLLKLGPSVRGGRAYGAVAGRALVMIAEHGSYNSPNGWTIYPQAYTVAGGKTTSSNVRYIGKARIEHTRERVARGERQRGRFARDIERIKRMVLAFGAPSATTFRRFARHKPIPAGHFVAKACERAEARSGEFVADSVIGVLRTFQ